MGDNNYDMIIYGASLLGVSAAAELKKKKMNILLCNSYGFPGGSITESLNCLQSTELLYPDSHSYRLLKDIGENKHGVFFKGSNEALLNPEVLKLYLQEILIDCNVDLLFHVRPIRIEPCGMNIKIFLGAREGEVEFTADKLIDASDDGAVYRLIDKNVPRSTNGYLNFITTPADPTDIESIRNLNKYKRLDDGRYWVSCSVHTEEELYIEVESQKLLNEITGMLMLKDARIQLLPARSFALIDKSTVLKSPESVIFPHHYMSRSYGCGQLLLGSEEFEKYIRMHY